MQSINQMSNENILSQNNYLSITAINVSDPYSTDIKTRNHFYKGEQLLAEEDESIEYKNYKMPLYNKHDTSYASDKHTQELIDQLKKQFCGFLNRKGGRIYIGITDDKIVLGIHLNSKDRDKTRNDLTNLTSDFYPKCRTEKIRVVYVPVKNKKTDRYITNIYVIKIIIKQGDIDRLYSTTSRGYRSFMRLQGQCVELSSEEIERNLVSRKCGDNVFKKVDPDDFEDIEPSVPLTSDTEDPIIQKNYLANLPVISNTNLHFKRNPNNPLPTDNDQVLDVPSDSHNREYEEDIKFPYPIQFAVSNGTDSQKLSKNKKKFENNNKEYSYKDKQEKIRRSENSPVCKKLHTNANPIKISISNLPNDTTKDNVIDLLKDIPFDSSVPIIIKRFSQYNYSCALVHFQSKVEAIQAKQLLEGTEKNNRIIHVMIM